MATKKVVKKKVTKKVEPQTKYRRQVVATLDDQEDETQPVQSVNREILESRKTKSEPAKNVAKVISLHVSIGNDDRDRSWEDFVEHVKKKIGVTKFGTPGIHASTMGGYYIVDGAICMPEDFDRERFTFKPGKFPPAWAGGPTPKQPPRPTSPSYAVPTVSKPAPLPKKKKAVEDDVEDLDWDESILGDDETLGKIADEETEKFIKKVKKSTKSKPVIKPAKKKTVKRATMVSGAKRGK